VAGHHTLQKVSVGGQSLAATLHHFFPIVLFFCR
jgi:hypothetical protein